MSIHYTLTNDAGEVLDSSAGREPLDYLHGAGHIVPGLEAALAGHVPGDHFRASVPPEAGYGARQGDGPKAFPRANFPPGEVQVGMRFFARGPGGDPFPVWIVGLEGEHVLIDINHPLAGATLNFEVNVVAVRMASTEELAHGHVHGPDGHGHGHDHSH